MGYFEVRYYENDPNEAYGVRISEETINGDYRGVFKNLGRDLKMKLIHDGLFDNDDFDIGQEIGIKGGTNEST